MADHESLVAMIRKYAPDQPMDRIDINREGMVNDIVIADEAVVFRFPKSVWGEQALTREISVLDTVRRHVSVPVPAPVRHHARLASHALITGEPLSREALYQMPASQRRALLGDLGSFLQELHAIPAMELRDVPQSDSVRTREDWVAFFGEVEEVIFPLLFRHQRQAVRDHFASVVSGSLDLAADPVLIHGDLAPYHILITPGEGHLAGIIDFGTAGLGDPATDIATLLACYGARLVDELAPSSGFSPEVMERARFRAGTLELQWALAGIRNNDFSLLVAHIGGARDYPPMGAAPA